MSAARGQAPASGPHRWVADDADLAALVDHLTAQPAYGLDTEFHRERTYHARLALLQLSWPDGVALVDPLATDVGQLEPLLRSDPVCVMHAATQDLEILVHQCGTAPRHLFDTQVAAGFVGYSGPGLSALVQGRLGVRLPKSDRLTDWLARPLPPGAAEYAAADVVHLLDLYADLSAELTERGRLQWAVDECDLLLARATAPSDPARAWWKIKEARSLRGRAAAVAQSVAAWRERRARELDRPVRFVLADLAIVAMAHRPPRTVEDLRRIRGLDDRFRKGDHARLVLSAVAEGEALDEAEVQLPSVDTVDRSRRATAALVSSWVAQRARDLDLDPTLLATRADVEALLMGETSRLAAGWRHDVAGEPIRLLIAGEASLAIDPDGRLALEARSGITLD